MFIQFRSGRDAGAPDRRARALGRRLVPAVLFCLLSACNNASFGWTEFRESDIGSSYTPQQEARSWIKAPNAKMVLERRARSWSEQRILLPNLTAIRGENFVLLRTNRVPRNVDGRFRPLDLIDREEGVPYPFGDFESLTFRTTEDVVGPLNWTSWTNNAGLTCVLGFRRLDSSLRSVPAGSSYMDMMLRNCVHGTEEEALVPIGPDAVGFAAVSADTGSGPQMLSPLAGPLP